MNPWCGAKDAHEEDTWNFLFADFNETYFPPEKGWDFHPCLQKGPSQAMLPRDVSIPPFSIHTFLVLCSLPSRISSILDLFCSLLFSLQQILVVQKLKL